MSNIERITIITVLFGIIGGIGLVVPMVGRASEEMSIRNRERWRKESIERFEIVKKYTPRIQEMTFEEWDKLSYDMREALVSGKEN